MSIDNAKRLKTLRSIAKTGCGVAAGPGEYCCRGQFCSGCERLIELLEIMDATPAPESPAPAPAGFATWWESYRRWDDDFRYPASEEGEHKATAFAAWQAAQSPVTPWDIGTGSETSPDAARLRKGVDSVLRWLCPDEGITIRGEAATRILSLLAKPAEQREAEQIPHLVWTGDKPTKPGIYRMRGKNGKTGEMLNEVIQVAENHRGLMAVCIEDGHDMEIGMMYDHFEWAGPYILAEPAALAQAPTRNGKGVDRG